MSPIISPIGKRENKRQQKQTTTTTTKRLSSGLVELMISIKKKRLTKMASCFFPGGLEACEIRNTLMLVGYFPFCFVTQY